jgi:signal transduction histidine kinase
VALVYRRRVVEAGRAIETHGGGVRACVDRSWIEQALDNLTANALRHGAGTIRLSAAQHGPWLELHVTDEGPGFPPHFAARAFARFTRADHTRNCGAGLGLAIVAAIAAGHEGSASVSNRTDRGADVCVLVPASPDARAAA